MDLGWRENGGGRTKVVKFEGHEERWLVPKMTQVAVAVDKAAKENDRDGEIDIDGS